MKKYLDKILDLIFPHRCPVCDEILCSEIIHDKCLKKLKYIEDDCCIKCGKYISVGELCDDCKKINHNFDKNFSVFIYNGKLKESIGRFKYSKRQEYANFFGVEMSKKLVQMNIDVEVIVPIPIHKSRLLKRGYNQAELLASKISEVLGIPMDKKLLKRIKNTKPLKDLSKQGRLEVMKEAISVDNCKKYDTILLVDDIYTTGTTLDVCSSILKEKGTKKVYAITIAA